MMRTTITLIFLLASTTNAFETITSKELYEGIQSGRFDVIVDVRTHGEWDSGEL